MSDNLYHLLSLMNPPTNEFGDDVYVYSKKIGSTTYSVIYFKNIKMMQMDYERWVDFDEMESATRNLSLRNIDFTLVLPVIRNTIGDAFLSLWDECWADYGR